jgi:flagellar M-ring protein FliF
MAVAGESSLFAQLQGFNRLSNGQKLGLIIGVAAVIALIVGGILWYRTPTYQVLFSNLSDRDGGAVIAALQQMNVPYKTEGTSTILVPMDQVYEVRLKLASQGLPKGSVVGFELMEGQKLGVSQFVEQVNYQRALEGELTRSILSLSAVRGARVHLAIPRPSVFLRDQQKPSASVLLDLGGRRLDPSQVAGIVHLVASSVPDLPAENVTVIDQNGTLLTGPDSGLRKAGLDPSQLEYLHQLETAYVRRIEAILSPIVGPDNVRAQVTAEVDFSQSEQTAESFKPNPTPQEAAVRSLQSRESTGGGVAPAGVPGALSNQPPGAASAPLTAPGPTPGAPAGAAAGPSQKEQTINYEVDKTIRHVRQPAGSVKRLSAAVVVNYRKTTGKDGKVSIAPLSQAELAQINNLVKEAMGFNAQRGDSVNVVNAAFNLPAPEKVETPLYANPWVQSAGLGLLKFLAIATIIWVVVFVVLRPILRELARPPAPPSLPEDVSSAAAEPEPQPTGLEQNLAAARELARQNPSVVANVVREWVGKEGA